MSGKIAPIGRVSTAAFRIPTDAPEADGTLSWDSTTLVTCEIEAGGKTGFGYTYCHEAAAKLIATKLKSAIEKQDCFDIPSLVGVMDREVRNIGKPGVVACAISAVDAALWDLKAKLLDLPLVKLLGFARSEVPIYGSGGFTTYSNERLAEQLGRWVDEDGCHFVKMKIGSDPASDPKRVSAAKKAIGEAKLFVDANGAFERAQALDMAQALAAAYVHWFEEPVTSNDLSGLAAVRARAPAGMAIAAGEYGYEIGYFNRMLAAQAVDVLQADASRCGGVSGFLAVDALCEAYQIDLSGHCAPSLHLHVAAASRRLRHLEWFHDHVRIEHMLFEGAPVPSKGAIRPDLDRPGLGLSFKHKDAARYEI